MSIADLTIRPFEPGDLPAMQRVRQAAFEPVFQSFRDIVGEAIYSIALPDSDAEQAQLLERLCRSDTPDEVFVASIEGEIVGFVSWSLDADKGVGEIGLNGVHPRHAGRGIGTRMYAFALERMKASGMAAATVGTGSDPSHLPARRAYEKAGFGPGLPSVYLYRLL